MTLTESRTAHDNVSRPHDALASCRACYFLQVCGGLDGQQELWGCFSECKSKGVCQRFDWTCPCRPREFARRLAEVGGNLNPISSNFIAMSLKTSQLPLYVPVIQHGSGRRLPLAMGTVALPTFEVIKRHRDKTYGPLPTTGSRLRRKFHLSETANILLVSPAQDHLLELYWAKRRAHKTASSLLPLRVAGMSLPNFSFFIDAPRTHSLWNRKRLMRVAQELAGAGVSAIPHLNTLTNADWAFFEDLLAHNPNISVVAKEFQTGASLDDVEQLARLQDNLKRSLHPLIIGGARFLREVARRFETFSLVDSQPFMKTVKARERLSLDPFSNDQKWTAFPTRKDEFLDQLLRDNIRTYEVWVRAEVAIARPQEAGQLALRGTLHMPQRSHYLNARRREA
jgi:Domain of unknown function (DUF4417)